MRQLLNLLGSIPATKSGMVAQIGALALATSLWSADAAGQERRQGGALQVQNGMVLGESGEWRAPTAADVLPLLQDPGVMDHTAAWAARSLLRQRLGPRPPEELDEVAGALADIVLAGDPVYESEEYDYQWAVISTLRVAANEEFRGTPHEGSFNTLVRIYETLAARALAGGGTDPFEQLHRVPRRKINGSYMRLHSVLRAIYHASPAGRGGDYVLALFEAAEPPERLEYTGAAPVVWCEAVRLLREGGLSDRMSELPEIARDDQEVLARCNRVRIGNKMISRAITVGRPIIRRSPGGIGWP